MADNKHIGSTLDDFLQVEGYFDELSAIAIKEVFAWQVAQRMKEKRLTKVAMANRMQTSRSQLDRLLDPKDGNVTLATMQKAAVALGEQLNVALVSVATHQDAARSSARSGMKRGRPKAASKAGKASKRTRSIKIAATARRSG